MRNRKDTGFTLIEMLVVIAIIGILASVVFANFGEVQKKSRDAKRKSDLQNIAVALTTYYSIHHKYPVGGAGSDRTCWVNQVSNDPANCPLGVLLAEKIMSSIPYDPGLNNYLSGVPNPPVDTCGYAQFYAYYSDGNSYLLGAVEETKGNSGCTQKGNWSGSNETSFKYHYYVRNDI